MQTGLLIEYTYAGDEAVWRATVETFIDRIRKDPKLAGKFGYVVMRRKEDPTRRVHIPRWDSAETLSYVQAQDWFKEFTGRVREFAGASLSTTPISVELDSTSPA